MVHWRITRGLNRISSGSIEIGMLNLISKYMPSIYIENVTNRIGTCEIASCGNRVLLLKDKHLSLGLL